MYGTYARPLFRQVSARPRNLGLLFLVCFLQPPLITAQAKRYF